ncbi:MAG: DUF4124 domain-containing protein [Halofilum sp. (in: g-proteobacteria)]|nr:DUF4124 domain-containing protein [Halofilum sp. (in: g-proteobacteria)]
MMVAKLPALCGLALGLVLSAPLQADEIYKWVDEEGVTHYSQQPPPSGDAARVGVDSPPDEELERERQEMEATGERLEARREERREAERQARTNAAEREQREQRCADLRSSLSKLTENRRLLVPDGEGNVRRLPEEERQERVAERRRQIEEECG